MTGKESLYPALDTSDVSYAKLTEMQERLLSATRSGRMTWERSGPGFEYAAPSAVVDVSPHGISLYDDRGNRVRRFAPDSTALYDAICAAHDSYTASVIESILGELEGDGFGI